ncbi:hypothetical protein PRZ48_001695 [Zasmidium cellare]|uniref:Uncharacterized protein n=1 Tax=Zasmidium cellare TaxID=395010 RepID=A0ABR0F3T9_ZASCE|nr:hypothetical protein PRZ48_001695 [Zasmidium cellare]
MAKKSKKKAAAQQKVAEEKKAEEEKRAEEKKAEEEKRADEKKAEKAKREAELDDLATKFENLYGRDTQKLEIWKQLCRDLGVVEGESIKKCKKNLRGVWVNIFDFIQDKEAGKPVRRCKSLTALRWYSIKNHKIFPLRKAKDNPLLRGLLVHMFGHIG